MKASVRDASEREIREHVRTPKPVDRLLRVSDHDEGSRTFIPHGCDGATVSGTPLRSGRVGEARRFLDGGIATVIPAGPRFVVYPAEDPRLDRVGVLVLVDEGAGEGPADPLRKTLSTGAVERVVELEQQVVVGEAPVVPDAAANRRADLAEDLPAIPPEPLIACRANRTGRILEPVERVEQRVVGHCAVPPACLRELPPAVASEGFSHRQPEFARGEQRLDGGQLSIGSASSVARPIQPGSLADLGPKVFPVFLPLDPRRFEQPAPRGLVGLDRHLRRVAAHADDPGLRAPGTIPRA